MPERLRVLPYTVVRITGCDSDGQEGVGTGFFYTMRVGNKDVPLIVSNKHVLCGMKWLEFDFATADERGEREMKPALTVRLEEGSLPVLEHPDPAVDIAVIPSSPMIADLLSKGIRVYGKWFSYDSLPPPEVKAVLDPATSVLMVGFPNGVMDEANNLPVVRRGSLATPYEANYQGKPNFVVDIAAFGGSSGSPILAIFDVVLPQANGDLSFLSEPQTYLIGILHSGPAMTADGIVVEVPAPTKTYASETNVMIHLGYCAKSHLIEDFRALIQPLLSAQAEANRWAVRLVGPPGWPH